MYNGIIYKLSHVYEYGEKGNEDVEIKELGLYSTRENAIAASNRYFLLPGFNQYPKECLLISECIIDKDDGWTEGFVNSLDIAKDFEVLTKCFNDWLGIKVDRLEDSWNDNNYYNALCAVNEKVYQVKNSMELAQHIGTVWSLYYKNLPKSINEYKKIAKAILESLNSK